MPQLIFANNASGTLNGPITNVATSLTLATGQGALFPNPSAGQAFLITLTDAATGLIDEICLCTARSGDVLTVTRAQEGTTAKAWDGGDSVANLCTAGTMAAMRQSINSRVRLTANTTFYVATTGSDSTGDGSVGNPWATMQYAALFIMNNIDIAGFNVEVMVGNGAYATGLNLSGIFVGSTNATSVQFTGNVATPSSCAINTTGISVQASNGCTFSMRGFKLSSTTLSALNVVNNGRVTINGSMDFGACPNANHIGASQGGFISVQNSYTVSGAALYHYNAGYSASTVLVTPGITVTITGTPAFGAFARAGMANLIANGVTFSGSATGQRYVVELNGVIAIQGGGANYFPGNAAGSILTGGQYA